MSLKRLSSMKSIIELSNLHSLPCHICPLAKQRQLSFPFNNNVADAIFDLIHCDIWSPFKVPTYDGYCFFLTLVDDHSRYTWVYLMRAKF